MLFAIFITHRKTLRGAVASGMFDRFTGAIASPVQFATVSVVAGLSHVWNGYVNLIHVQEQNTWLIRENERLETLLVEREEESLENERLRKLLELRESETARDAYRLVARVIAVSPSSVFQSVRIDSGERQGVRVGDPVVSEWGVVGRVASVGAHFSDVMLLTDSNSSIDVVVQRTRSQARVRGLGDAGEVGVHVQYLSRTSDVEPGDILITSGIAGIFPKGLRVGKVVSVDRRAFGLYLDATVVPNVDFSRLETVMVLGQMADLSEK